jgi:glucose-1-phosphate adenylyltransferase
LASSNDRLATADFARDLVPEIVRSARVLAYVCDTPEQPHYWRTLNSVDRYWHAHMELLDHVAPILRAVDWPIFTRHQPLPPARVLANAHVDAAIVSPGATVAGEVMRSIVSTRCRVGANACVRDSVLLPGAIVGDGCVLDKVIVDCATTIPRDTEVGIRSCSDSGFYSSPDGVVLATSARSAAPLGFATRAIA